MFNGIFRHATVIDFALVNVWSLLLCVALILVYGAVFYRTATFERIIAFNGIYVTL